MQFIMDAEEQKNDWLLDKWYERMAIGFGIAVAAATTVNEVYVGDVAYVGFFYFALLVWLLVVSATIKDSLLRTFWHKAFFVTVVVLSSLWLAGIGLAIYLVVSQ